MKEIKIKQLHLVHFKGVTELKIDFADRTDICGGNGTGKTTIFDAFTWLMFGKDSADRTNFAIKTLAGDGQYIPRLDHEVAALLEVTTDGHKEEILLMRRYTEKWTKKRGTATEEFTGHKDELFYNDVPVSAKEYKAKIAEICDEQVFKFATNPLYFTSQKMDVQRAMLFRMAGEINVSDIVNGNEDFAALLANITGKTMDEYKREIAAKKRRIKEEMDGIPSRIDERRRDTPQPYNWAAIEADLAALTEQYNKQLDVVTAADEAAKAADAERRELYNKRSQLKAKQFALEAGIRDDVGRDYKQMLNDKKNLCATIAEQELAINTLGGKAKRLNEELAQCTANRERLIGQWRAINAEKLEIGEDEFTCPCCGRRYDADEVQAKAAELTAKFNENKAKRLAENNAEGKANKAKMESITAELAEIEAKVAELTAKVADGKANQLYTMDITEPDYTAAFAANKELAKVMADIADIEAKVAEPLKLNDTTAKDALAEISAKMDTFKNMLAVRDTITRNEERIAELERELKALANELAELEREEFTIAQFSKAKVTAIEERINSMFKVVKFKLYDQQINGGEVETCVATANGVPFADLNNAMKINAGLDIIAAISRHEGIAAPIFVDNAEAVNHLNTPPTQVIRLVVTNDEVLTINNN